MEGVRVWDGGCEGLAHLVHAVGPEGGVRERDVNHLGWRV